MRISGGIAKGRRIGFRRVFSKRTEGAELRPTSSKVREALFDIIRKELPESSFLDLYAGTGGVGIEALSRGAGNVVFVEYNALSARMIDYLLSEFGFKDRARVVKMNAYDFIIEEAGRGNRYDIIFVDPPYHSEEQMKILPVIGQGDILEKDGTVIAEHFSKIKLPDVVGKLRLLKSYKYGDTTLSFYKAEEI
jgi:16S rRNA (guanine(966)-N(2))-methyltransferase RsmD